LIVGIAVSVAVLVVIGAAVFFLCKARQRRRVRVDTQRNSKYDQRLERSRLSNEISREIGRVVDALPEEERVGGRFEADWRELVFGSAVATVLPIADFMCVDPRDVGLAQHAEDSGLAAMEAEFMAHGTEEDKECFHYVRYGKTGDNAKQWPNGVLDEGREKGLSLEWFVEHREARAAQLTVGMVLALRLYTTACYKSINNHLRGFDVNFQPRPLSAEHPHPLPITVHLLTEAIGQLRAVEAKGLGGGGEGGSGEGGGLAGANQVTLWRGLRNVGVSDEFLSQGGAEKAPMSTTRELEIAIRYSASACSVLLKLETGSFRERGADLSFLSAFPGEVEVLYPPLTHLAPTSDKEIVKSDGGLEFTVIEVRPTFG